MKFSDIPKFIRSPNYKVHCRWGRELEQSLEHYAETYIDHGRVCGGVDLDPDFQRAHVWTEAQQIAYVEFVLRGGASGRDLLFNCIGWDTSYPRPITLVDGKQRLNAALKFTRNELPVFGGNYFKDFEDKMPYDVHFIININNLKSRAEVLQWYIDLNRGGTVHTDEEINKVKQMLDETQRSKNLRVQG